jgi:hypothetical protein
MNLNLLLCNLLSTKVIEWCSFFTELLDPNQTEFQEVKNNLVDMIKITKDCLDLKKESESAKKSFPNIHEEATRRGIYVGMLVEVCLIHCSLAFLIS